MEISNIKLRSLSTFISLANISFVFNAYCVPTFKILFIPFMIVSVYPLV